MSDMFQERRRKKYFPSQMLFFLNDSPTLYIDIYRHVMLCDSKRADSKNFHPP